ncbi:hypothetical protein [Schumannella sp. 10F1B-5-1]|uniref:hypothetical protein n=1 Tax=Schumannella sp. 10F1B-5-1 TaxID=2590780 RepID=UPI00113206F8|nr:hypothetical protein [Schumannella sp. 10F1B-5-1]TPW71072.1 hypothetical protein FJ658_13385 [Schumannella sp. 10F1B-5-1]
MLILNFTVKQVYVQHAAGHLPAAKRIGKHMRWHRGTLSAWLVDAPAHSESDDASTGDESDGPGGFPEVAGDTNADPIRLPR